MIIKKKKRRSIPRHPERMILIGIYHDPDKGILIARKDDGSMELPGGKIWRHAHHTQTISQIAREETKISKIVFEKCGLSLSVAAVMGFYTIEDPVAGKTKFFKVIVLKPSTQSIDRTWQRLEDYEGEFILGDLEQILKLYPNLSSSDQHILVDYFNEYLERRKNGSGLPVPRLVKFI